MNVDSKSNRDHFRLNRHFWRIKMLFQALQRRCELWGLERDVASLRLDMERELEKLEVTWQRWESVRSKREKESIRKKLSGIEQRTRSKLDLLDDRAAYIEQKQRLFRTMTRWLWQGHIDDRDGDPELILTRSRDGSSH